MSNTMTIDSESNMLGGTMSVNDGLCYGADVRFGGFEESGVGRRSGVAGFDQYREIQSLAWPSA